MTDVSFYAPDLLEQFFQLVHKALLLRIHLVAADFCELPQKFFLARVQIFRREDFHDDVLVAAAAAAEERDAAIPQAHDLAALRPRFDFHIDGAVERRDLHRAAERRFDE